MATASGRRSWSRRMGLRSTWSGPATSPWCRNMKSCCREPSSLSSNSSPERPRSKLVARPRSRRVKRPTISCSPRLAKCGRDLLPCRTTAGPGPEERLPAKSSQDRLRDQIEHAATCDTELRQLSERSSSHGHSHPTELILRLSSQRER